MSTRRTTDDTDGDGATGFLKARNEEVGFCPRLRIKRFHVDSGVKMSPVLETISIGFRLLCGYHCRLTRDFPEGPGELSLRGDESTNGGPPISSRDFHKVRKDVGSRVLDCGSRFFLFKAIVCPVGQDWTSLEKDPTNGNTL